MGFYSSSLSSRFGEQGLLNFALLPRVAPHLCSTRRKLLLLPNPRYREICVCCSFLHPPTCTQTCTQDQRSTTALSEESVVRGRVLFFNFVVSSPSGILIGPQVIFAIRLSRSRRILCSWGKTEKTKARNEKIFCVR